MKLYVNFSKNLNLSKKLKKFLYKMNYEVKLSKTCFCSLINIKGKQI